jgi:hypothetical protein
MLFGGARPVVLQCHFTPKEGAPYYPVVRNWVHPTPCLYALKKRKEKPLLLLLWGTRRPGHSAVRCRNAGTQWVSLFRILMITRID